MTAWRTPNSRTGINIPFQHGKSQLGSKYFPAWVLLNWPETRVALASYEETFASTWGGQVKDVVDRFGPDLGIHLKADTQAKGEWVIEENRRFGIIGGGGMVCKGRGGALIGRPADLLILDDLIKNAEEAQSPTILENIWDWYCTVAYSRLGPTAPIIGIGTRWGPKDIFGRWEAEGRVGGDKFTIINLSAIAGLNDPIGRAPGEALWPERVPLARLEKIAKSRPRWFKACWQGKPEESSGLHFQPDLWRTFTDTGDAWRIFNGVTWHSYLKAECTVIIAVDWAQAGKKTSDHTAFVVAALTSDGLMLVLDVFCERLRYEENAPALVKYCRRWKPDDYYNSGDLIVASDDDMLSDAMMVECRRYHDIPEIKLLGIKSRSKLIRAQAAIIRSQNGLFLKPDPARPWYEIAADQLRSFTGEDGAEDDIADCVGLLGRIADEVNPDENRDDDAPTIGAEGYSSGW